VTPFESRTTVALPLNTTGTEMVGGLVALYDREAFWLDEMSAARNLPSVATLTSHDAE
jgi:hypothetical protein